MSFNFINNLADYLKNIDWKYIDGWDNKYIITSKGEVISVGGKSNHHKPIILSKVADKDGYYRVRLSLDKYNKTKRVNILVAEAFVIKPNDPTKLLVNHIDENVKNNNADNLEWVTNYGNWKHSEHKNEKKEMPVVQLDLYGNFICRYKSLMEASRITGIQQGNITNHIKGRNKSVGGYKWTLEEDYEKQ